MQAMHGSAGARHSRNRMIGCLIALFALTALVAPSMASAAKVTPPVTSKYLALGDSLAFGYSQQLYNECKSKGDPAACFENGYPNDYLKITKGTANGVELVNNGCPGETTASFIGKNLQPYLDGALTPQREKENEEKAAKKEEGESPHVTGASPCGYQEAWNAFHKNGTGGPLHHPYVGKSQLESALGVIGQSAAEGKPVSKITLDIGANDELQFIQGCEKKAGEEVGKSAAEGKYNKQVEEEIAKGEYVPSEAEPPALRGKHDAEKDGQQKGEECVSKGANGLFAQIAKNTQAIYLALRHGSSFGSVDYNGRIVYQDGYNPYGDVFGTGELKPGTNELAGVENLIQNKVAHAFGACTSDPQLTFNPRNKNEPPRLQKWTNMANFTEFEGKKNGPDIHPTPLGYKKLASLLKNEEAKEVAAAACI
jgi:hypothetical protein